MTSHNM